MPATDNRDLASNDLWLDSLQRSRRRRWLAADGRKEQNRKKTASLAVSAAVVAGPAWPSAAGSGIFQGKADAAKDVKPPDSRERVLLSFGDRSSAVASLQHKLKIMEDGIFGPQTEAAVKAFQKRHKLRVTGDVDVKTWLAAFPNDAIVASSGTGPGGEPGWSAVTTQPAGPATAAAAPTSIALATDAGPATRTAEAASHRKSKAHKAKTSSLLPLLEESPGDQETPATPPVDTPAPSTPGPLGGQAPSGGQGAPAPAPKPAPPAPRPLAPLAPGGSFNDMIEAMIREANRIDRARYAYRWGGGHNSRFTGPYDCSGAVSAVLHAAGLLSSPMVSGNFTNWGARGRGVVTIYANSQHVYMSIRGRFFGTSRANPGGGAGWFNGAPRAGFVVVHVPFERMKPRKRVKLRARAVVPKRGKVRMPAGGPRYTPQGDSMTGGAIPGTQRQGAASPTPAPTAPAPVTAPAPTAPTAQPPVAPAQPAPAAPLRLPVQVTAPQVPTAPASPQAPSGPQVESGPVSTPPTSGSAPTGSAPTTGFSGPASGSQPPSAPVPTGTNGQQGSSDTPAATPPPAPSSGGPVSELGNKAVNGAGEAVEKVTSGLPAKPDTAPQPAEGSGG